MIKIKREYSLQKFYNKIIYPKQFGKDTKKLIFHITNTCFPIVKNKRKLVGIISNYIDITKHTILQLEDILAYYDRSKSDVIKYNCFSQIKEYLEPEDLYFYKSSKKRIVTLKEYKYILQRVTKKIYKTDNCKSVLVNKYFLKSGLRQTYKEVTTKSLCGNKLAHILQVLQKHNYLHIVYNHKNQRVVQIGPNNPFYMIGSVPDVELQDVDTATDRMISKLVSDNSMLESAVKTLRQELADVVEQNNMLNNVLEQLQTKNDSLIEMLAEKENMEQSMTEPTYETNGSFVTYRINDRRQVELSLN